MINDSMNFYTCNNSVKLKMLNNVFKMSTFSFITLVQKQHIESESSSNLLIKSKPKLYRNSCSRY